MSSGSSLTIARLSPMIGRHLNKSTAQVESAYQRLSSGLRVNKASDDAAGLAVSNRLMVDKRIYTKGIQNLNDGISAVNIADTSLEALGNIAGRIQELATQSANGVLSDSQRGALQSEATSLQAEWNRIVETTTFNRQQLLTGSTTSVNLQGGYGVNGNLTVQYGDAALTGANDNRVGATIMASQTSGGVIGNGNSGYVNMSADGRYLVYQSGAANLVSGDSNGFLDIFVKDTVSGTVTRVNISSSGAQTNNDSFLPNISADGRYVTFHSHATNLVAGDTNGVQDVFVKDLQTGSVSRVSTSSSGAEANGAGSYYGTMSADGRYVAFQSFASNLVAGDTNGVADIFVKDTLLGTTTRVSVSSSGAEGNAAADGPSISSDGRYVTWESAATNLVAGDSNGRVDIFVRDLLLGTTTRLSTDSSGNQGNNDSTASQISADGKFVMYQSTATNLVSGDTNGVTDLFVKELATGITTRISTDSSGVQAGAASSGRAISADGRYIGFVTSSALVSNDTNGLQDIYVRDTVLGTTTRVSTSSTGVQGASGLSDAPAISADGQSIAFHSTFTNLVSGDSNGSTDIFYRSLANAGVQTMSGMVVSNQASARITLGLAERYQSTVTQYRASLGTSLSRLDTFSRVLENSTMNYAIAAARITDIDVAEETAGLVTAQIRQQTATAVMAQANQQAANVLKLFD